MKTNTEPAERELPRCPHCGHDFVASNSETYDCRVQPYEDIGDPVICGCDNAFHLQQSKRELPSERVKLIPMTSTWSCPKCNHQNVYREGVVSDPQNKCAVCGTKVIIGAVRADVSGDAKDLGAAIAQAAQRAGIYNGEVPLTGPQLVMLCDDLATAARVSGDVKQRVVGEIVMLLLQNQLDEARALALTLPVEQDTDGPFVRCPASGDVKSQVVAKIRENIERWQAREADDDWAACAATVLKQLLADEAMSFAPRGDVGFNRGLEEAAKIAHAYLSDERNGVKNNPSPDCVAHAIRASISAVNQDDQTEGT